MEQKAWGGRFRKNTAEIVEAFTASISFDWELYDCDIDGSIAHATMLAEVGLISQDEKEQIVRGLEEIRREIAEGTFEFRQSREDIHMHVELALTERIGEAGKRLHTARSRNDQVATDLRLWVRRKIDALTKLLRETQQKLVRLAEQHVHTIAPGYTHLQRAMPVSLGQTLLAYVEMLQRDVDRLADCRERLNVLPLGACALAGTSLPINRRRVAELLGFKTVARNSIDAVSDRDFVIEFLSGLSLIALHLSRLAEEWILWASDEFKFIEIDDAYCTGSSIMPQKKNPDVLELIRGKAGRVVGALATMCVMLKGLPLAYNRDLQEDKPPLFDAAKTVEMSLLVLSGLLDAVRFCEDRLLTAAQGGYSDATALAEYLVRKGVPFREAHRIVGEIVAKAIEKKEPLKGLSLGELQQHCDQIEKDVFDALGAMNCVRSYQSEGSASPAEVKKQIEFWKQTLLLHE